VALAACGLGAALLAGALLGAKALWPTARITGSETALARVQLAPFGERVSAAAVVIRSGHWVKASIDAGVVEPLDQLAAGSRVTVELTVRRAGWLGWLVGSSEHIQAVVETPAVHLSQRLIEALPGRPLELTFSAPVAAVSLQLGAAPPRVLHFTPPRWIVPVGVIDSGANSAGSLLASGSARLWERLPPPVRVSWFPAAPAPEVLVRPAPKSLLDPTSPIILTFSRPVSSLLGARRPTVWPRTRGRWSEPNANTLVFQPGGLGFPLGTRVHLGLGRVLRLVIGSDPASVRTLSWRVPAGSVRRLEELLGELDYLPFDWHPSGAALPQTEAAQADAAIAAPAGALRWRYHTPAPLKALWDSPSGRPLLIRGALMAFESAHGMTTTGEPSAALWRTLLRAALADKRSPYGYSYVYVSESLPETLTLWHDGRVILTTPVNTGIPGRWTALGTYPVYLHLAVTTMTGTNPDGSHYSDPGVPWVNYFNGGDAVHGFIRPGYGYPQSLGCVEAPIPTAARIWPFVQVGTLVTVAA